MCKKIAGASLQPQLQTYEENEKMCSLYVVRVNNIVHVRHGIGVFVCHDCSHLTQLAVLIGDTHTCPMRAGDLLAGEPGIRCPGGLAIDGIYLCPHEIQERTDASIGSNLTRQPLLEMDTIRVAEIAQSGGVVGVGRISTQGFDCRD